MTPVLSQWIELAMFLLTYLAHSTFIVLIAITTLAVASKAHVSLRIAIWKAALVVPVLTASVASLFTVPHFGAEFVMANPLRPETQTMPSAGEKRDLQQFALGDVAHIESAGVERRGDTGRRSRSGQAIPLRYRAEAWLRSGDPWTAFAKIWFVVGVLGCSYLGVQAIRLFRLRQTSTLVDDPSLYRAVKRLRQKFGLRRRVDLLESHHRRSPLTSGILHPFILVPSRFVRIISRSEREALLAHELAHVERRDALWILISQLICRIFFLQPLNNMVRRRLQIETEFMADWRAAQVLQEPSGLTRCLSRLGEWLAADPDRATDHQNLAAGMASFRSTLGQRVEQLVTDGSLRRAPSRRAGWAVSALLITCTASTVAYAPRAIADTPKQFTPKGRDKSMLKEITALALLAGFAMPSVANDEAERAAGSKPTALRSIADKLPDGMKKFNGMLVGRLAKKDVEKGTFIVRVDAVPRVWRNSKAESPKSVVGQHILIDGVSGKWLDVLLLVKEGETLEFEARHDNGDKLTFPGELLRKVAPFRPEDYPVLPEEFRGFSGAVAASIVRKDAETFEMIVRVDRVLDTWKNNHSKDPKTIEGKQMMLAGFWNRKETYHQLKLGDSIEVGLRHMGLRSDHLTVAEFVRKVEGETAKGQLPAGLHGFSGMLVGRLTEKDVERGTFAVQVDAVPRIWRNNKAENPKSIVGHTVEVDGVTGKWLDVLLLLKPTETLEFEANHNGGGRLAFLGEWMRKAAPVKPGDFPELPEDFRGFEGGVIGTVAKINSELAELALHVTEVQQAASKSRAKDPQAIIGHDVTVLGFWRHRDAFDELKVGDKVACSLRHIQLRSDHVNVADFQKVQ